MPWGCYSVPTLYSAGHILVSMNIPICQAMIRNLMHTCICRLCKAVNNIINALINQKLLTLSFCCSFTHFGNRWCWPSFKIAVLYQHVCTYTFWFMILYLCCLWYVFCLILTMLWWCLMILSCYKEWKREKKQETSKKKEMQEIMH